MNNKLKNIVKRAESLKNKGFEVNIVICPLGTLDIEIVGNNNSSLASLTIGQRGAVKYCEYLWDQEEAKSNAEFVIYG